MNITKYFYFVIALSLSLAPSAGVEAVAGGVVGGLLLTVLIVIILVVLVIWCVRRDPVKVKSPPQVIEMNEGLQVSIKTT